MKGRARWLKMAEVIKELDKSRGGLSRADAVYQYDRKDGDEFEQRHEDPSISRGQRIAVFMAVLVICFVYMCFLQFGRDMDVINSIAFSCANFREVSIRVNLNKMIISEDVEEIAGDIIERVLENGFKTIRFDLDVGYCNRLKVSVYKNNKSVESGDMLFSFTYSRSPDHGGIGTYNISQAEYMELEICE